MGINTSCGLIHNHNNKGGISMNQFKFVWRYVRYAMGRFGGHFNRNTVFKDARDVGKILFVSSFLGLIANDGGWMYLVSIVAGVLLYVWASVNEG